MTVTTSTFNKIERLTWHKLETFSQNHSKASKYLLPLPVAIGHIAKSTLINPLRTVEHVIQIGINGYRFFNEPDSKKAWWFNNNVQVHIGGLITSLFSSIITPLFSIFQAVYLSTTLYISPLKSTKIMASKQDLIAFLEEENLKPSKGYSNGVLETFACQYKYAKHAYKHFRKKVLDAKVAEVANLHFCDTLASRNLLVTEINAKNTHYDKNWKAWIDNHPKNELKLREAYRIKWIKYQKDLLHANLENLDAVTFDIK